MSKQLNKGDLMRIAQVTAHLMTQGLEKENSEGGYDSEFKFRISSGQKSKLRCQAKILGMSMAETLRFYIEQDPSDDREEIVWQEALEELSKQINKVGVNINQIARKCNTGDQGLLVGEDLEELGRLSSLLERVQTEIGRLSTHKR